LLQPSVTPEGSDFELVRPLFLSTASAADIAAFIDSEAGIAAYFQAPCPNIPTLDLRWLPLGVRCLRAP
jgi:hypothetical protein